MIEPYMYVSEEPGAAKEEARWESWPLPRLVEFVRLTVSSGWSLEDVKSWFKASEQDPPESRSVARTWWVPMGCTLKREGVALLRFENRLTLQPPVQVEVDLQSRKPLNVKHSLVIQLHIDEELAEVLRTLTVSVEALGSFPVGRATGLSARQLRTYLSPVFAWYRACEDYINFLVDCLMPLDPLLTVQLTHRGGYRLSLALRNGNGSLLSIELAARSWLPEKWTAENLKVLELQGGQLLVETLGVYGAAFLPGFSVVSMLDMDLDTPAGQSSWLAPKEHSFVYPSVDPVKLQATLEHIIRSKKDTDTTLDADLQALAEFCTDELRPLLHC